MSFYFNISFFVKNVQSLNEKSNTFLDFYILIFKKMKMYLIDIQLLICELHNFIAHFFLKNKLDMLFSEPLHKVTQRVLIKH